MTLGIFVVDAINSHQLDGPARPVLTAVQVQRLYGAGTKMATPSATRVDSISSYIMSVSCNCLF